MLRFTETSSAVHLELEQLLSFPLRLVGSEGSYIRRSTTLATDRLIDPGNSDVALGH